jgi:hypothetical protein
MSEPPKRKRQRLPMRDECPRCFVECEVLDWNGGGVKCPTHGIFWEDFQQLVADLTAEPDSPDTDIP